MPRVITIIFCLICTTTHVLVRKVRRHLLFETNRNHYAQELNKKGDRKNSRFVWFYLATIKHNTQQHISARYLWRKEETRCHFNHKTPIKQSISSNSIPIPIQTKPKQNKTDKTRQNQTKPDKIKPIQTKPNQTKPSHKHQHQHNSQSISISNISQFVIKTKQTLQYSIIK